MSKSFVESIYETLPVSLQHAACSYYGWKEVRSRFNDLFNVWLEELIESEYWSAAEIEAYQREKLSQTITHAYETVPYYRDVMKQLHLTPKDIRSKEDLQKLPILTKEDVRKNFHRLISEQVHKQDIVFTHTSGTTGKSLHFYKNKSLIPFQWAIWWRHRKRFGIDVGTWHANFTGKIAVPVNQKHPPFWRWNLPMRQVVFNMQHLIPSKIESIINFLNTHPFWFYNGYPSVIHAFVTAAQDKGQYLSFPPSIITTGAENMLDYQRQDIQNYTGAILTDQYGLSEGCGNASHCSELVYHEDFEFGIMECVDPKPLGDGREKGTIVCTGFANTVFPFIRYEVGDVGIWHHSNYSCPCGRKSRILTNIEGRVDDYIITPEGHRIMRFDYIFKDTQNVKESQIIQDKLGEITVRIVRRSSYSIADENLIRSEIKRWISPQLTISFAYVQEIERETNGKFRAVKSLLR
jgi:phenylacetate-CoA ligase